MKSRKDQYIILNFRFSTISLLLGFFILFSTTSTKIYSQGTIALTQSIEFGNVVMTPSGGGIITVSTTGGRTGAIINLTNNIGTVRPLQFTIEGKNQTFQNITINPITLSFGANTLTLTFGTPSPPPPYTFSGATRLITVTVGGTIDFAAGKPSGTYINSSAISSFISVF